MKRSKSQAKYFKTWNPELLKNFRKQKNYYSRSYKKERKTFFNSLKVSNITGNKMFQKNVQPIFSENLKIVNKITLIGDNKISNDKLMSLESNNFFQNVSKNL